MYSVTFEKERNTYIVKKKIEGIFSAKCEAERHIARWERSKKSIWDIKKNRIYIVTYKINLYRKSIKKGIKNIQWLMEKKIA